MTNNVDYTVQDTATVFQQNWVTGCSAKGKQRIEPRELCWCKVTENIYLKKMC